MQNTKKLLKIKVIKLCVAYLIFEYAAVIFYSLSKGIGNTSMIPLFLWSFLICGFFINFLLFIRISTCVFFFLSLLPLSTIFFNDFLSFESGVLIEKKTYYYIFIYISGFLVSLIAYVKASNHIRQAS